MPKRVWVKAATEHRVPMEDRPRRYIEAEPVEVTLSTYYIRRIDAGELVQTDPPAAPAPAPKGPHKEGK